MYYEIERRDGFDVAFIKGGKVLVKYRNLPNEATASHLAIWLNMGWFATMWEDYRFTGQP